MFRQSKNVVRRVVVGIALDYQLPRQGKIKVQAHPPEEQKKEVQAAKSQIPGSAFGMRPQCEGRQRRNQSKEKKSITCNRTGCTSAQHNFVVEPDRLRKKQNAEPGFVQAPEQSNGSAGLPPVTPKGKHHDQRQETRKRVTEPRQCRTGMQKDSGADLRNN